MPWLKDSVCYGENIWGNKVHMSEFKSVSDDK